MLFDACSNFAEKTFQKRYLCSNILLIVVMLLTLAMPLSSLGGDFKWLPLKGNSKVGVKVYLYDGTYHARVTEIDEASGDVTISMPDGTTGRFSQEVTDQLRFKVRSDDPALDTKKK